MDIQTMRDQPHLSASAIGSYVDCGLSYRFSKIDKIKPEFTPNALVFGSVIHKILEFYHHGRMLGQKPSLMDLTNLFEEKWRKAAQDNNTIKYKEEKGFEALLLEGKSLLATYYTEYPETGFKVIALEEPFSFRIEGLPIPIIGIFDMLEEDESGALIITDHKTTSKAYSADEVDSNFQMTLYGMALKANGYADREILLRLDCLVKTKKPKFEQYYTVRSEDDEHRVVKKILAVWEGISKGVFLPNDGGWKCKGCMHQAHCAEWFKN